MDLSVIAGAYQGVKAVKDAISDLIDAKASESAKDKVAAIKDQLGGVQDTLFTLRETLGSLQDENDRLRTELAEVESWSKRAAQYELTQAGGGAFVYRFIGQPQHFACPRCFESKEIHILQPTKHYSGQFPCPKCEKTFPVEPRRDPNRRVAGMY